MAIARELTLGFSALLESLGMRRCSVTMGYNLDWASYSYPYNSSSNVIIDVLGSLG